MNQNNKTINVDWVNLAPEVSTLLLDVCLHDAEITSIVSSYLDRNVSIEFDISYLRDKYNLDGDQRFIFKLKNVQSLRATTFDHWPGAFELPKNISREEESRLVDEFHLKGIEKSVKWEDAEKMVNNCKLSVSNSELAYSEQSTLVTISLHGFEKKNGDFLSLYIRGESIDISRNDGLPTSLSELIKFGEEYWDSFDEEE